MGRQRIKASVGVRVSRVLLTCHALLGALLLGAIIISNDGDIFASPMRVVALGLCAGYAGTAVFGLLAGPSLGGGLAVTLTILTVGAIGADAYLGRLAVTNPRAALAMSQSLDFDIRWAPDVALDLRAQSDQPAARIYPTIVPNNFFDHPLATPSGPVLPLGGPENASVALCNESGGWQMMGTDRHGLPNDKDTPDLDHWHMAVVGDSFVEGWCVENHRSFVGHLRSQGSLLNLGRGGAGPLTELALLREFLSGRRTETLLWSFFEGNDWEDFAAEQGVPALMAYLTPDHSQHLRDRHDEVQAAMTAYGEHYLAGYALRRHIPIGRWRANLGQGQMHAVLANILRRPAAAKTGQDNVSNTPAEAAMHDGVNWDLLESVAGQIASEARLAGARPYLVYLPSFESFPERSERSAIRKRRLLTLAAKLDFGIIDGDAAFRQASADPRELFPFKIWGHYTEQGHAIIARTITDALSSQQ